MNMTINCPFLKQLKYCYALACIQCQDSHIDIYFDHEINFNDGALALHFLLQPLQELEDLECTYTIKLHTPKTIYVPCQIHFKKGTFEIHPNPITTSSIPVAS